MKSFSAIISFAGLVSTVAGHGFITSPAPRQPGKAMAAACGQQMFSNQASDNGGNVQGELQVTKGQSDFNAAACNVFLCKGYKFADNTANVQKFTAGQVVPITVDIRAPHTGVANVSIVKTSSNSIIGATLISWDDYASVAHTIPDDQKNFKVTIPSNIGTQCATAGDCVIQWFWDARSIDQTYESCIDFTVGASGSAPAPSPTTSSPATTTTAKPAATSTPATSAKPSATATSVPTVGDVLPQEFTLDTFIAWLQKVGKSTKTKRASEVVRSHARAF